MPTHCLTLSKEAETVLFKCILARCTAALLVESANNTKLIMTIIITIGDEKPDVSKGDPTKEPKFVDESELSNENEDCCLRMT